MFKCKILTR